jgi:hypothetical protein
MYVFSGGYTLFPVPVWGASHVVGPGDEGQDEDEESARRLALCKELLEKAQKRTRAMIKWAFFAPFGSFLGLFCFGLAVLITVL